PYISPLLRGRNKIHPNVIRIHVGAQVALRHGPTRRPLGHFPGVAERDALPLCKRPQEASFRLIAFFAVHVGMLAGVTGGHNLLTVARDVGGGGPAVSLRAHFGIWEEAIEQTAAPRQCMAAERAGK